MQKTQKQVSFQEEPSVHNYTQENIDETELWLSREDSASIKAAYHWELLGILRKNNKLPTKSNLKNEDLRYCKYTDDQYEWEIHNYNTAFNASKITEERHKKLCERAEIKKIFAMLPEI